jgi:hypothetical protein
MKEVSTVFTFFIAMGVFSGAMTAAAAIATTLLGGATVLMMWFNKSDI